MVRGTHSAVDASSKSAQRSGAGPSDAALVIAARAGERWAQEALFRRYARMVNGLSYRLLGRDDELDDLVQDSFLQALRSLDRLENPQAFASWLGAIVIRTAHKRLRRRSLAARLGLRPSVPIDPESIIARGAPVEVRAELGELYGELDRMRPDVRTALLLHNVEGMTVPQVADAMSISSSTVKRRLADGRKRLTRLRAAAAVHDAGRERVGRGASAGQARSKDES